MNLSITSALLLYKLASLSVGLVLAYFGYRLFMASVWGNAGEMSAKHDKTSLMLKSAAPGTFFVVLGAAVLIATVAHGLNLHSYSQTPSDPAPSREAATALSPAPEVPKVPRASASAAISSAATMPATATINDSGGGGF